MKKIQLKIALQLLVFTMAAAIMPAKVYSAEDAAIIDPARKGSIIVEYYTNDGMMPVTGASFVFRRIAEPVIGNSKTDGILNGIIWTSLLGTMEINEFSDTYSILKAAKEAYLNGDPKNGGKTYSGITDTEGRLVLDGIEQGIYVAEEVGSAKGYLESEPFVFSIPYVTSKPLEGVVGAVHDSQITPDLYGTSEEAELSDVQTGSNIEDHDDQEAGRSEDLVPIAYELSEGSEANPSWISEHAPARQYWSYVVNAQPKPRKEQESTPIDESSTAYEETTDANTSESKPTEGESAQDWPTEPVEQSETTSAEPEPEHSTSFSEETPEATRYDNNQNTETTSRSDEKKRDTTVKTGDGTRTWLFAAASLISVGIAVILAVIICERRRRSHEGE